MATWKKVLLAGDAGIGDLSDVTINSASDAQILVHDGTDFDNVSVSGDVTITNAGTVTIGDDKVTTVKILDANVTTAKIAGSAVTLAKMAANSVDSDQYVDGSIDTAHIANSQVTLAKMADLANMRVIGNTSGADATPSAVTILDEDNMASNSATALATQQSIKAYVDGEISTSGGGTVTGVDLTGDSGTFTEQESAVTIEFATGDGITSSVADDIDGSGNPGVKHVIDASQTVITSILNTSLKMGRDAENVIDFATTDNAIIFRANGANQLKIDDGNLVPLADGDITLGANGTRFASGFFDSVTTGAGTVQGNLTINNSGNISVAGTSTLTGNVTASANLTVEGDLTVNGTTTTIDTTHLLVQDHIIEVATNASPSPDNGTAAGLEVQTSSSAGDRPRFEWTKDLGASNDGTYDGAGTAVGLTGWKLSNHQESNQAYFPIAVMEMVGDDATAPAGNSAGIGSFFFASSNIGTADGELYLRVR